MTQQIGLWFQEEHDNIRERRDDPDSEITWEEYKSMKFTSHVYTSLHCLLLTTSITQSYMLFKKKLVYYYVISAIRTRAIYVYMLT
jgi:hypothetical protein